MRRGRGFTLLEIAIVITILSLLATLLMPVYDAARNRAKEAVCMQKLRDLHSAVTLYRETYGRVEYGTASAMGLPIGGLSAFRKEMNLPVSAFECSAGAMPFAQGQAVFMFYFPSMWGDHASPKWEEYVEEYRGSSILIGDLNHGNSKYSIASPYLLKRGIGIYLGGNARIVNRTGDSNERTWWNP